MRSARLILRGLPWVIIAMLSIPAAIPAQESASPDESDRFSKEELTQMLAPIALYPDSLVAQILMASTYPLEIVEAERWLRENRDLKGEELDEALKDEEWDPSVKSLCHFPDVLFALSGKLDQTRKLGDAFLAQEDDVAAEIQELRRRAEDRGSLRSTREQNVIVEPEIIRIEPADPEVVYVPVYDPLYVYGPWWYPAYPPYYWYYPSGIGISGGFIGFGPRIFLGFGLFSWTWFDWNIHRIHVDHNRIGRFDRHHFRNDFGRRVWRHDPGHRRGVAYRDRRTSRHFGPRPIHDSPRNRDFRGPTRAPGTVTRGTEPSRRQVERRRSVTPPIINDRHRFENRLRRDTPSRGGGEGRFERRGEVRRGENRRSVEIGTPRRTFRPDGGEIRPGGGSRTIERGVRSGGGESRSRGVETRPRGVETRSPGVEIRRQSGETRQQGAVIRPIGGLGRHGGGERNWGGPSERGGQFRREGRRQ